MIIIGMPLGLTFAATGGGSLAMLFAAILSFGVDMFTDSLAEHKKNKLHVSPQNEKGTTIVLR